MGMFAGHDVELSFDKAIFISPFLLGECIGHQQLVY
jgi:hypothetical protein